MAQGFRGFIAPASLKLQVRARLKTEIDRFRGFIAPASLKRRGSLAAQGGEPHGFRGFIAPASLKRDRLCRPVRRRRRFPGLYRPGLIEACSTLLSVIYMVRFPGLYRPGLIEATSAAAQMATAGAVSGALSPRPH